MRIRILWLSLWLGLVGGSIFAVVLRLPPSRQPSSDRVARAGPPEHPRDDPRPDDRATRDRPEQLSVPQASRVIDLLKATVDA